MNNEPQPHQKSKFANNAKTMEMTDHNHSLT